MNYRVIWPAAWVLTKRPEVLVGFLAGMAFDVGCDDCSADTGKCDVYTCLKTWIDLWKEIV